MQTFRKREIRRQADYVREKCRTGRYGIIDIFKDCGSLGYSLIRYPLGLNANLGFAMLKEEDTVIFTNTSCRLAREIFTLAHEIGHVVLHMGNKETFIDNNSTLSFGSSDEKEQEANYFAACLLMPDDVVSRFLDLELTDFSGYSLSAFDIARIMSEFNVSFEMALNRLENLGKITAKQRLRIDNEKNQSHVGNFLRSIGGNARLNVPSDIIDIPYEYLDYAIYNYNHNAIPEETLKRVLTYYHLTMEDIFNKIDEKCDDSIDLDELIGGLTD